MRQENQLLLERCPHCNVVKPALTKVWSNVYNDFAGQNKQNWCMYHCTSCGNLIMTSGYLGSLEIKNIWPKPQLVDENVPVRAREFLTQAIASLQAPAGAVMLTASAVDAMLKDKGYKEGSLYSRIDAASKNHLITKEMAAWAHEIRLDANDQRHADEEINLPNMADVTKAIEFASALAQFLFVLPARVERGREKIK